MTKRELIKSLMHVSTDDQVAVMTENGQVPFDIERVTISRIEGHGTSVVLSCFNQESPECDDSV